LGGGSSGSGGGGSPSSSSKDKTIQNLPNDLPEKTKEVLGAATNAIQSWFVSVPIETWILIGLGIFVLILIGIAFSMFVRNWVKGALISGLDDADADKPVNLMTTSPRGIKSVKQLIYLAIKVTVIVIGIILGLLVLFGIGFLVFSQSKVGMIIWGITIGTLGLLIILATIVLTSFASVYAERLIVLHGYDSSAAFKKGFSLAKGNFIPSIIMGIINGAIGCSVGCVSTITALIVLGVPAAIILIPSFINGFHMPSPFALVLLGILILIYFQLNLLMNAGLVIFNCSNWNIFVKEILKQEEKK
jgi:hypothetical protein